MSDTLSLLEILHSFHRYLRYSFRTEPDTASFVKDFAGPGDTCLDIGAHKGVVTQMMRRQTGAQGKIYAFEPQPELMGWLERMKKTFGYNNVLLEELALAEDSGERRLSRRAEFSTGTLAEVKWDERDIIPVDSLSLDQYCESRGIDDLSFIKIDVDSLEMPVPEGARRVLEQQNPILLVEIFEGNLEEVSSMLDALGYDEGAFEYKGKRFLSSETKNVSYRHENARFRNFLFRPANSKESVNG